MRRLIVPAIALASIVVGSADSHWLMGNVARASRDETSDVVAKEMGNLWGGGLGLESVWPTVGELGKDLEVMLTGSGFDEDTRVSMAVDVLNARMLLGAVVTPGEAHGVTVAGSYAYVTDSTGLQIVDVENSKNPVILGSVRMPGSPWAVAVVDEWAYVAAGSYGVHVVDVSNPLRPVIVESVDTPGYSTGVTVAGDLACVADGGGLQIVDVSDRRTPILIGSVDTGGDARGVAVVDGYAYVAEGLFGGLTVVDIRRPTEPLVIASVADQEGIGPAYSVAVVGDYVYVANARSYDNFEVYDVSNPSNPQRVTSIDTPGYPRAMTMRGDLAYIAAGSYGLQLIDIGDPLNPLIVGSVGTPEHACGVSVLNNCAYVANGDGGLQLIDVNDPSGWQMVGSAETGDSYGVAVADRFVYVATGYNGGISVVDISVPGRPQIVGSVHTPGLASDVALSGGYAYVADSSSGLQIVDVRDPGEPLIVACVDATGSAQAVAAADSYVYVAVSGALSSVSKLQIIDVNDPLSPLLAGSVSTLGHACGVTVVGRYAYVASGSSGLHIIDIRDPAAAEVTGSVRTSSHATGVSVAGDYAYVADSFDGLHVVDIQDPTCPVVVACVDTPGSAREVVVSGDNAYVADVSGGLQVIDIRNPEDPVVIETLGTPGNACCGVSVAGDYAYLAARDAGLVILPKPVEIQPVTVSSATNISLVLTSPSMEGYYSLRVFSGSESDELSGAVAFLDEKSGSTPAEFEDPNLEVAVETALGVIDPTASDMLRLNCLDGTLAGITSLVGLENATNLRKLYLAANQITNIDPLLGLVYLEELDLDGNQISDIGTLLGLRKLSALWLRGNPLSQTACNTHIPQIIANNPGIDLQYDECECTITISSTSGGSVVEPGEGVFAYNKGREVSLLAVPDSHCEFTHWSGNVSSSSNPVTVTMDHDVVIKANFQPKAECTLTLSSSEGGSVWTGASWDADLVPDGAYPYPCGTELGFYPKPDEGYWFDSWTGTLLDAGKIPPASAWLGVSFALDGHYTLVANFIPIPPVVGTLTISSSGGGRVSGRYLRGTQWGGGDLMVPLDGTYECREGGSFHLSPDAFPGYHFVEWTGTAVNAGKVTPYLVWGVLVAADDDYTIVANFKPD